jgi:PRC-barrel domain protein
MRAFAYRQFSEAIMNFRPLLFAVVIAGASLAVSAGRAAEPPISAAGPAIRAPQPGMAVFSSDGQNVGTVESIDATQDGRITAVNIAAGGFLGLGRKLVAIPEGRFGLVGTVVRASLTADEIGKLPHQGP